MILSGVEIQRCVEETRRLKLKGTFDPEGVHRGIPLIDLEPFDPDRLNPNSYNCSIGDTLRVYDWMRMGSVGLTPNGSYVTCLDPKADNPTRTLKIPESGLVLIPGTLYLAATAEWTETFGLVPEIDGRSSSARLGIQTHAAAGLGDVGFYGNFVLEITVAHPVKVYPGMQLVQIKYHTVSPDYVPYKGRYQGQCGPTASRYHLTEAPNNGKP